MKPVFGRDADMIIPLQLDVDKAGIYRVRANLFTKDNEPVAFLTTKKQLPEGEHTVELKAFKQALRGFDEQWQLKNIVLERMSGYPGERAQFGISLTTPIHWAPLRSTNCRIPPTKCPSKSACSSSFYNKPRISV
ncbi:hypothetical protein [Salinivibrio socompensis]|nr:hypothetical protein [Salinivibrio socompensis]